MAPSTPASNPTTTHVLKKSSIVNARMAMVGKKVRVIAKIRSSTDLEKKGIPWISVNKHNGDDLTCQRATITFEGQPPRGRKESYELNFCYDQSDTIDLIFSREVKPLISGLFDGRDATVFACGARGSGKTHTIQGTEEQPGLAVLALGELLSSAPVYGKSIAISLYEIDHEHVYDLLSPKRQQVLVLKDAQGKIQLKGLSQVAVMSPSEIHKLYSNLGSRKTTHKIANESPNRIHIGLTIHVLSPGGMLNTSDSKINFIDLSGYEGPRRKSTDGINLPENAKINKSIYALQNVFYALSANESHVPFRESKVTHMLQDSLGGESKILMITCLNPSFCQDSIYMMNLASRCCQGTNRVISDSTKKSSSSVKPIISWSVSSSMKKQIRPQTQLSMKKGNCPSSAVKVRLFDEGPPLNDRKTCSSKSAPTIESSLKGEACSSNLAPTVESSRKEEGDTSLLPPDDANFVPMLEGSLLAVSNVEAAILPNKDVFSHPDYNGEEEDIHGSVTENFSRKYDEYLVPIPSQEGSLLAESNVEAFILPNKDVFSHPDYNGEGVTENFYREGEKEEKENNSSSVNAGESPPISTRLQELSNNLKLLYSSIPPQGEMAPPTPSYQDLKPKNETCDIQTLTDLLEPTTPNQNVEVNDKEILSFHSPWETFHARSFGPKNSLVQEYVKFLNSASKEELKKLKGIGEKRATYILELREETPEPFKELDDLKDIGLSSKQIKGMMEKEVGGLFK